MILRILLRSTINLLRLIGAPLWWIAHRLSRPKAPWIVVRLRPRLTELQGPLPWILRWFPGIARQLPTPIETLARLARSASADDRITGVVFEIPHLQAGWAACASLREIFATLRRGGKKVVAYLPQGGGNREIWVAAAADRVLLAPEAMLAALGLSIEARYLKPLLDKVGVHVEVEARGEYKTAAETAVRDSMSAAQREQLEAILGGMDRLLVSAIAARPGMNEERARDAFRRAFLRGSDAVEAGLADGVCYEDELPNFVTGDGEPARMVRAPRWLAWKEAKLLLPLRLEPFIAVVQVEGAIVGNAPSFGRGSAAVEPVVAALRAARRDRRILGVVLHVDSPGGSALASDLIHREVERLAEKKPVVAYFGNVAASGGYYVAAPAHAIVAQPVTITGSIGVVSAKLVARSLMEKIGVRVETLRTAPHADMLSPTRDLDSEEREILSRQAEGFYRAFVAIVARGRKKTPEEIDAIARGRVWIGADAKERGLVDRLGGFDDAVDEVRARLPIPEKYRALVHARPIHVRGREEPPPEPPPPGAPAAVPAAAAGALAALGLPLAEALGLALPELRDLVALTTGPDRVWYYAFGLPRID